jgi:hypothetical protein
LGLTVKDFATTLKIKDDTLLERMKAAGLSHTKSSDEITPADKLAILKSLKERKSSGSSSVTYHQAAEELQLSQKVLFPSLPLLFPAHLKVFQITLRQKGKQLQKT